MIVSVMKVLKGSVIAQFIGFLTLPLWSRTFGPDVFGDFQLYQSILAVSIVVVMLRYEVAILRAPSPEYLLALLKLCSFLLIFTTALLSVGLIILFFWDRGGLLSNLSFAWWLIPVGVLLMGISQILTYYVTRLENYGQIASSKMTQAMGYASLGSGLAIALPISSTLVLAELFGRLVNIVWLGRFHFSIFTKLSEIRLSEIRAAAIRDRDLSLISLPGAMLSTIGGVMTPVLIYGSFSAETAGQYGLVERSLALPVAMVVGAISQVHMGSLGADLRDGTANARARFLRLAGLIAGVSVVPILVLIFFAGPLFAIVFGPGWGQAAKFAQMLAPAFFFALISGGINMTLTVVGRQKTQLAWDGCRFCAIAGTWYFGLSAGWAVETLVSAYSALLSIFSISLLVLSFHALPKAATVQQPHEVGS